LPLNLYISQESFASDRSGANNESFTVGMTPFLPLPSTHSTFFSPQVVVIDWTLCMSVCAIQRILLFGKLGGGNPISACGITITLDLAMLFVSLISMQMSCSGTKGEFRRKKKKKKKFFFSIKIDKNRLPKAFSFPPPHSSSACRHHYIKRGGTSPCGAGLYSLNHGRNGLTAKGEEEGEGNILSSRPEGK